MMLKIKNWLIILVFALGFLVATPAKTEAFFQPRPIKLHPPRFRLAGFWHYAEAKPGQPVTLEGKGVVRAHGKGEVNYQIDRGRVMVAGQGVAAVRGTDQIFARGWGGQKQIGDWTFYWGKGVLRAKGENFRLLAWGRLRTGGRGQGKATFRGWWKIRYHGFGRNPIPLEAPVELPEELKSEAEVE